MKNILILSIIAITFNLQGQTSLPEIDNQTVSWDENHQYSFYLQDGKTIHDITGQEQESVVPYGRLFSKKYIWNDNKFSHFEVKNHQPLTDNAYFSFPVHWAKYYNGYVSHVNEYGQEIYRTDNIGALISVSEWEGKNANDVLPITKVNQGFSFYPVLGNKEITKLTEADFNVIQNASILRISRDSAYFEFNKTDTTFAEMYYNFKGEQTIITSYYTLSTEYLVKTKETTKTYRSTYDGICYMELKEVTFNNIQVDRYSANPPQAIPVTPSPASTFEVFPNPFSESFTITFDKDLSTEDIQSLLVYDMTGSPVTFRKQLSRGKSVITFDGMMQGTYIVKVNIGGRTYTRKIAKF